MENNNSSGDFFDDVKSKADGYVSKYNYEEFTNKFSNFGIVKSFLNNNLFLNINSLLEKHIQIISLVIGWLSIIGGLLMLLSPLNVLLGIFGLFGITFLVYLVVSAIGGLIIAVLTFINGLGLIQMKKWVPFTTIVLFLFSNGINIFTSILNFTLPFYSFGYQYGSSFFGVIIGLFISLFISFVCTCFIVKNKDIFNK